MMCLTRAMIAACAATLPAAAALAVTVGNVDEFAASGDLENWGGGSFAYTNPGTGGVGGVNDGFLFVNNEFAPVQLGTRSGDAAYIGDWTAAGATGVSLYLRDETGNGGIQIHFGIGTAFDNFWQYNLGFNLTDEWQQFTVDFSDESQWTQTIGGDSFADALADADRILLRHDLPPFFRNPDPLQAGFGVDRIVILPAPGAVGVLGLSALVAVRRRR